MRLLLVIAVLCLTGCSLFRKGEQVTPAGESGALASVGKNLSAADSKIAAAVTVAVENKDKPQVVEAEGRLALSFLPAPLKPDLEAARVRASKADPKAYAADEAFARGFLSQITADWKQAQTEAKANAARLSACFNEIAQLKADLASARKEASEAKSDLESARNEKWTVAGIALVVIGSVLSATMGFRVGGAVIACGALCGAMPSIYGSEYFKWIAGGTLALAAGLGLWRLWDHVRDLNDKTK